MWKQAKKIHADIGSLESNPYVVGNTLIDMYANCGSLAEAREVFDKLPVLDESHGMTNRICHLGQEAVSCFEQIQLDGISLDAVTFVCS